MQAFLSFYLKKNNRNKFRPPGQARSAKILNGVMDL